MTNSIMMVDTPKDITNIETKFKETSCFKLSHRVFLVQLWVIREEK